MDIGVMCLFKFWFPQGVCTAMVLLGCMAVLFPIFQGIATLFSIVAVLVCIPTNSVRGLPFLHTLSNIIVCRLFDDGHSDQHEKMPYCGFDLHFSSNEWCWISFHVFISHLCVFFGECLFSSFAHFLMGLFIFLVLSSLCCLHILEINPLSVASFAIIFSQSEGCLFTLLIVSFIVQNYLSLIRPHLFIFGFSSITLGGGS